MSKTSTYLAVLVGGVCVYFIVDSFVLAFIYQFKNCV